MPIPTILTTTPATPTARLPASEAEAEAAGRGAEFSDFLIEDAAAAPLVANPEIVSDDSIDGEVDPDIPQPSDDPEQVTRSIGLTPDPSDIAPKAEPDRHDPPDIEQPAVDFEDDGYPTPLFGAFEGSGRPVRTEPLTTSTWPSARESSPVRASVDLGTPNANQTPVANRATDVTVGRGAPATPAPVRNTEMQESLTREPIPAAPTSPTSHAAATAPPPQVPAVAQLQLAAQAQLSAAEKSADHAEMPETLSAGDTQHAQTTRETGPANGPATVVNRAETARAVAGQMAAVVSARPGGGAIDIALNPEELGRLTITVNGRDDGMHLSITAERPETLDLMRRHISILSDEFRDIGFGDLSFDLDLSQESPGDDAPSGAEVFIDTTEGTAPTEDPRAAVRSASDRGLDIRI